MLSRREAIAAGGSALLLAGCGTKHARLLAGNDADLPILGTALELERTQIVFYGDALRVLRGQQAAVARAALEHEREHAAAIAEAIRELGGTPAAQRPAAAYRHGFPASARADAWLRYAIAFEDKAVDGYAAAIPKLVNARLRATFASIMTTEAEHSTALGLPR